MTPHQVVTMVLASVTVVGVAGGVLGIPLGMLAHRYVVPADQPVDRLAVAGVGIGVTAQGSTQRVTRIPSPVTW